MPSKLERLIEITDTLARCDANARGYNLEEFSNLQEVYEKRLYLKASCCRKRSGVTMHEALFDAEASFRKWKRRERRWYQDNKKKSKPLWDEFLGILTQGKLTDYNLLKIKHFPDNQYALDYHPVEKGVNTVNKMYAKLEVVGITPPSEITALAEKRGIVAVSLGLVPFVEWYHHSCKGVITGLPERILEPYDEKHLLRDAFTGYSMEERVAVLTSPAHQPALNHAIKKLLHLYDWNYGKNSVRRVNWKEYTIGEETTNKILRAFIDLTHQVPPKYTSPETLVKLTEITPVIKNITELPPSDSRAAAYRKECLKQRNELIWGYEKYPLSHSPVLSLPKSKVDDIFQVFADLVGDYAVKIRKNYEENKKSIAV